MTCRQFQAPETIPYDIHGEDSTNLLALEAPKGLDAPKGSISIASCPGIDKDALIQLLMVKCDQYEYEYLRMQQVHIEECQKLKSLDMQYHRTVTLLRNLCMELSSCIDKFAKHPVVVTQLPDSGADLTRVASPNKDFPFRADLDAMVFENHGIDRFVQEIDGLQDLLAREEQPWAGLARYGRSWIESLTNADRILSKLSPTLLQDAPPKLPHNFASGKNSVIKVFQHSNDKDNRAHPSSRMMAQGQLPITSAFKPGQLSPELSPQQSLRKPACSSRSFQKAVQSVQGIRILLDVPDKEALREATGKKPMGSTKKQNTASPRKLGSATKSMIGKSSPLKIQLKWEDSDLDMLDKENQKFSPQKWDHSPANKLQEPQTPTVFTLTANQANQLPLSPSKHQNAQINQAKPQIPETPTSWKNLTSKQDQYPCITTDTQDADYLSLFLKLENKTSSVLSAVKLKPENLELLVDACSELSKAYGDLSEQMRDLKSGIISLDTLRHIKSQLDRQLHEVSRLQKDHLKFLKETQQQKTELEGDIEGLTRSLEHQKQGGRQHPPCESTRETRGPSACAQTGLKRGPVPLLQLPVGPHVRTSLHSARDSYPTNAFDEEIHAGGVLLSHNLSAQMTHWRAALSSLCTLTSLMLSSSSVLGGFCVNLARAWVTASSDKQTFKGLSVRYSEETHERHRNVLGAVRRHETDVETTQKQQQAARPKELQPRSARDKLGKPSCFVKKTEREALLLSLNRIVPPEEAQDWVFKKFAEFCAAATQMVKEEFASQETYLNQVQDLFCTAAGHRDIRTSNSGYQSHR